MKPSSPLRPVAALALAALLTGCASVSQPVVYSPPKAPPTDAQRVAADTAECRKRAESAVGVNGITGPALATRSARRAGSSFVDEAVDRLVSGTSNVWGRARGAAAGAVAGGVTSVALNWNEPDSVHRRYVDLCMKKQGHTVLGWR